MGHKEYYIMFSTWTHDQLLISSSDQSGTHFVKLRFGTTCIQQIQLIEWKYIYKNI